MLEAPLTSADTFFWPCLYFPVKCLSFLTEALLPKTHSVIQFSALPMKQLLPPFIFTEAYKQGQGTWLLLLGYPICLPLIWGITVVRASYRRLETKAKLKPGLSTNTGTRWQGGDPITPITHRSPCAAGDTGTNSGKQIHTCRQRCIHM